MGVDAMMQFTLPKPLTDDELRRLNYEIGDCFPNAVWRHDPEHSYTHDPVALEDEAWAVAPGAYRVSLMGRYYGPGYERGNPTHYISVAWWLELRFPGCVVYYGGDSCELGANNLFGAEARERLMRHYVEHGGRPYYTNGHYYGGPPSPDCPHCREPMWNQGLGPGDRRMFSCVGCDTKVHTNGKGEVIECSTNDTKTN